MYATRTYFYCCDALRTIGPFTGLRVNSKFLIFNLILFTSSNPWVKMAETNQNVKKVVVLYVHV